MAKKPNLEYRLAIEGLKEHDWMNRKNAIYNLGKKSYISAVPHLVKHLYEKESEIRKTTAWSLSKIRSKLLRNGRKYSPKQNEHFALMLIDPKEHPKSFFRFLMEIKKGKNRSINHWELTAKQFMALERMLKWRV
ncbi:HEAT repeat domain-containing protein [Candidatus Micrarchaeota archaeon]|nr:HEAT repeat domain-containing protein [Candidatus Micrarchaeota archaeon]